MAFFGYMGWVFFSGSQDNEICYTSQNSCTSYHTQLQKNNNNNFKNVRTQWMPSEH